MARRPDMMFGPLGNVTYEISPEFSQFLIKQNKYQMNLSLWKQYLLWKYTVGSAPITAFLLRNLSSSRKPASQLSTITVDWEQITNRWTFYFFDNYDIKLYGKKNIEAPFRKWLPYFENPRKFVHLEHSKRFQVSKDVIEQFQMQLRRIIEGAPPPTTDLYLYKASGFYSGIPLEEGKLASSSISQKSFDSPVVVEQKPFNSTTYNPRLDFDRFLDRDKRCCMFEVKVPKGTPVLAISSYIHAHPYEKEVLLLPDVDFEIVKSKRIGMTFIEGGVPMYELQSAPYHIGPVFEENLPSSKTKGKWYALTLFQTNLVS